MLQSRHRALPAVHGEPFIETADWLEDVGRISEQAGFGRIQVLDSTASAIHVRLTGCRSCHSRAARTTGCEIERYGLECAVKRHVPHARVAEVNCHARDKRVCVFEIQLEVDE